MLNPFLASLKVCACYLHELYKGTSNFDDLWMMLISGTCFTFI